MPIYERDEDGRIAEIAAEVCRKYHGELEAAGVRVDYLFAHAKTDKNGDPVGAALKLGGYHAAAIVRVVGLKDRVKGHGDAEVIVDGDRWDEWSEERKAAILDHELTHLELIVDEDGVKRDDYGRPRLRCRLHDRQFGWFDAVARRHGPDAVEVEQAANLVDDLELRQLYLPGFDPEQTAAATARRDDGRAVSDAEQAKADKLMQRMGHKTTDRRGPTVTIETRAGSTTMPLADFKRKAKAIAKRGGNKRAAAIE